MKIINDGLSDLAYRLMCYDGYTEDAETEVKKQKSYASTTALLKSPKEFILGKRHSGELVSNSTDRLWMVFGTAFHELFEKMLKNDDKYLIEKRMFIEINGKIISGKFDAYDKEDCILYDLKTTSRSQIEKGQTNQNDKWTQQLNIYAYMIRKTLNLPVKKVKIIWVDKYYSKGRQKYLNEPDLMPIGEIQLPLWTNEVCETFIKNKLNRFEANEHLPDNEIPLCSFEDRFMTPPKIAIYTKESNFKKDGELKKRTKATKLCNNVSEFVYWLKNKNYNKIGLEFRPSGEAVKCLDYCNLKSICNGYTKARLKINSEKFDTLFFINEIEPDNIKQEISIFLERNSNSRNQKEILALLK